MEGIKRTQLPQFVKLDEETVKKKLQKTYENCKNGNEICRQEIEKLERMMNMILKHLGAEIGTECAQSPQLVKIKEVGASWSECPPDRDSDSSNVLNNSDDQSNMPSRCVASSTTDTNAIPDVATSLVEKLSSSADVSDDQVVCLKRDHASSFGNEPINEQNIDDNKLVNNQKEIDDEAINDQNGIENELINNHNQNGIDDETINDQNGIENEPMNDQNEIENELMNDQNEIENGLINDQDEIDYEIINDRYAFYECDIPFKFSQSHKEPTNLVGKVGNSAEEVQSQSAALGNPQTSLQTDKQEDEQTHLTTHSSEKVIDHVSSNPNFQANVGLSTHKNHVIDDAESRSASLGNPQISLQTNPKDLPIKQEVIDHVSSVPTLKYKAIVDTDSSDDDVIIIPSNTGTIDLTQYDDDDDDDPYHSSSSNEVNFTTAEGVVSYIDRCSTPMRDTCTSTPVTSGECSNTSCPASGNSQISSQIDLPHFQIKQKYDPAHLSAYSYEKVINDGWSNPNPKLKVYSREKRILGELIDLSNDDKCDDLMSNEANPTPLRRITSSPNMSKDISLLTDNTSLYFTPINKERVSNMPTLNHEAKVNIHNVSVGSMINDSNRFSTPMQNTSTTTKSLVTHQATPSSLSTQNPRIPSQTDLHDVNIEQGRELACSSNLPFLCSNNSVMMVPTVNKETNNVKWRPINNTRISSTAPPVIRNKHSNTSYNTQNEYKPPLKRQALYPERNETEMSEKIPKSFFSPTKASDSLDLTKVDLVPYSATNKNDERKVTNASIADENSIATSYPSLSDPIRELDRLNLNMESKKKESVKKKSFQCPVCNEIFSSTRSLSTHLNKKHVGAKGTFTCNICGFVTPTLKTLERHERNIHRDKLELDDHLRKCDICLNERNDHTQYRRQQLYSHIWMNHEDPSPYYKRCPLGGGKCITFHSKWCTLYSHAKLKHGDENFMNCVNKLFPKLQNA